MQIQIANYDFIPPEIILNGLQYIPKVTEIKEEIEKKDDLSSYDKLIKLVEEFEGFFPKAYKCPAKVWTIGYGTTIYSNGRTVKEGDTITREKAYSEMMFELDKKWKGISRYITVPTNKNQQSALISFAYNCGIGAFAGSTLLKKLNLGLYKEIPNELLKWTKGGGVHLKDCGDVDYQKHYYLIQKTNLLFHYQKFLMAGSILEFLMKI